MSLSFKPVVSRRRFASAPYTAGDDGVLAPVWPRCCPEAALAELACRLHVERWRRRRFGPGFDLLALFCVDHGHSFTIYPPAWPPYSRAAVVAIDHRGRLVTTQSGQSRWHDTAFEAAVDAARDKTWPEEVTLGPSVSSGEVTRLRCKRTQQRHVAGAMRLFALDAVATWREREFVCRSLGLDLMPMEAGAQRIRDGPCLKVRGEEGAKVLEQLPAIVSTISGLLALGTSRGYWGPTLS